MFNLISNKLAEMLQKNADELLKRWKLRVLSDPTIAITFTEKNMDYVVSKATDILTNLGKWMNYDTSKDEIGKKYAIEGKELFKMKIPLCEVIRAYILLNRTIRSFVENETSYETTLQLYQIKELTERVIFFFDRAVYYSIRGYMEAMNKEMKALWNLTQEDTEKIFFYYSFYNK